MANQRQTPVFLLVLAGVTLVFFGASVLRQRRSAPTVTRPTVLATDPVRGATSPTVTVVEFGDFLCPACRDTVEATATIGEGSTTTRLVWKDFPLAEHAESFNAAVAARCAGAQGFFWPYHDRLFSHQAELGPALYLSIARELKMDQNKFQRCQADPSSASAVEASHAAGVALGITILPAIFVNDRQLEGAVTPSQLQAAIAAALSSR